MEAQKVTLSFSRPGRTGLLCAWRISLSSPLGVKCDIVFFVKASYCKFQLSFLEIYAGAKPIPPSLWILIPKERTPPPCKNEVQEMRGYTELNNYGNHRLA